MKTKNKNHWTCKFIQFTYSMYHKEWMPKNICSFHIYLLFAFLFVPFTGFKKLLEKSLDYFFSENNEKSNSIIQQYSIDYRLRVPVDSFLIIVACFFFSMLLTLGLLNFSGYNVNKFYELFIYSSLVGIVIWPFIIIIFISGIIKIKNKFCKPIKYI